LSDSIFDIARIQAFAIFSSDFTKVFLHDRTKNRTNID
jgi:hypothetical protein